MSKSYANLVRPLMLEFPDLLAELVKVRQIRASHDALAKRWAELAQSRKNRVRDAKRQALKEYPKLSEDDAATAKYRKHAERLAKLERGKELA